MAKKTKYPEPKRVRVGRNLFVCGFDNHPIKGLSWDKGNGTYYYTFFKSEKDFKTGKKTRKDYSFGVHYQEAVFAYIQWAKDNTTITFSIPYNPKQTKEVINTGDTTKVVRKIPVVQQIEADKAESLDLLKQLLQDEEIKIEAIRILKLNELLPQKYKLLPLMDIYNYYKDNNSSNSNEKGQVKRAVTTFTKITKKKYINYISEEDIFLFRDVILASNNSTTYKNGKLQRFKTVLRYYNNNKQGNGEKELVRKILSYCSILKKVKTVIQEPPIKLDSKTVEKLFKEAKGDKELLLMFLLMLNCGYTPVDLRGLKKNMVKTQDDLTYILFPRKKTGETLKRVNCLWGITAKLLKEQMKSHKLEYVFISSVGREYQENTLGDKFRAFFKNSKVKGITPKHFKDTVASELAFKVTNTNILKITLGHTLDTKDIFWRYVDSKPEQQKPASDILYKKFKKAIDLVS
jgi:integrase